MRRLPSNPGSPPFSTSGEIITRRERKREKKKKKKKKKKKNVLPRIRRLH